MRIILVFVFTSSYLSLDLLMTWVMQRMRRHSDTRMITRVIRNGRRVTAGRGNITQCVNHNINSPLSIITP